MKKSLIGFGLFVFVTFLTLLLPVYVLLSGSATLLPAVDFAVALSAVGGFVPFLAAAILIVMAEKQSSIDAHRMIVSLAKLAKVKVWRLAFSFARYISLALVCLALNKALAAGFVIAGLLGTVLYRGMIEAYFDRIKLPSPFIIDKDKTVYINSVVIDDGALSATLKAEIEKQQMHDALSTGSAQAVHAAWELRK